MSLSLACAEYNLEVNTTDRTKKCLLCDGCNHLVHASCTELSKVDITYLQSKKKGVKFYCTKCDSLEEQKQIIQSLKQLIEHLQSEIYQLKSSQSTPKSEFLTEEVIKEISDRQIQSHVIRRVMGTTVEPKHVYRLGNKLASGQKPRLIKAIFQTPDLARSVLQNRAKFKGAGVNIFNDQTEPQRKYLQSLRCQLSNRINDGEGDLTIKYIRGTPRIVKTPKNV